MCGGVDAFQKASAQHRTSSSAGCPAAGRAHVRTVDPATDESPSLLLRDSSSPDHPSARGAARRPPN